MLITADILRQKEACADDILIFEERWPDGCGVNEENCLIAFCVLGLSADWAAEAFLVDDALAEYRKAAAPALADYRKARAPAWADYEKVTAPALAEFKKVTAPALAEFSKVAGSIFCRLVNEGGRP